MLRIMTWNIERFGLNKMVNNTWDHESLRRRHIVETLTTASPDVFVLVEVQTNPAMGFGALISDTSGGPGLAILIEQLRGARPEDEWMVVPPMVLTPFGGYSEGIAVLFKASVLSFEGPMAWTAEGVQEFEPMMETMAYEPPWEGALPVVASVLGPPQDHLAGQYQFFDEAEERWAFPGGNARSVWRTRFHHGATGRFLDIFAVHFPPNAGEAREAVGDLAQVTEVCAALGAAEDRVILGDFNINVNVPWEASAFGHLTGGPVAPGMGLIPLCPVHYQRLFEAETVTAIRPVLQAEVVPPFAPYYGYAAINGHGVRNGLDNALVARTIGPAPPNNQTVINRVVGTAAPGVGAPGYGVDMVTPIPVILGLAAGAPRWRRFNTLVNYGHIGARRGASDHLGIVFELP
jgi:hypothetical protein